MEVKKISSPIFESIEHNLDKEERNIIRFFSLLTEIDQNSREEENTEIGIIFFFFFYASARFHEIENWEIGWWNRGRIICSRKERHACFREEIRGRPCHERHVRTFYPLFDFLIRAWMIYDSIEIRWKARGQLCLIQDRFSDDSDRANNFTSHGLAHGGCRFFTVKMANSLAKKGGKKERKEKKKKRNATRGK